MDFKDYYKVLGVERSADADTIKKAFRRMARKYHPDVNKEADASARMSEVNEAYAALSDPEKRAVYDRLGTRYGADQGFEPPPDWDQQFRQARRGSPGAGGAQSGGFNFGGDGRGFSGQGFDGGEDYSDFFSSLFGRGRGGAQPGFDAHMKMRGQDQHARIVIDLADSYSGARRTLGLRVRELDGQGQVVNRDRQLEVSIPEGVKAGQRIRLSGQGNPGLNGGEAGDLYLEVAFNEDPRYRIEERDVHQRLPVTPWEAGLGAELEVATPAGTLSVRVPPDSQQGRKLRLRGKGIPGRTPGDLYLELAIVLPPADSPRARELYEQMARDLAFNPRQP